MLISVRNKLLRDVRVPTQEDLEEVTTQKILELEGLHKVCEAYLWLAMRFPASFPDAGG